MTQPNDPNPLLPTHTQQQPSSRLRALGRMCCGLGGGIKKLAVGTGQAVTSAATTVVQKVRRGSAALSWFARKNKLVLAQAGTGLTNFLALTLTAAIYFTNEREGQLLEEDKAKQLLAFFGTNSINLLVQGTGFFKALIDLYVQRAANRRALSEATGLLPSAASATANPTHTWRKLIEDFLSLTDSGIGQTAIALTVFKQNPTLNPILFTAALSSSTLKTLFIAIHIFKSPEATKLEKALAGNLIWTSCLSTVLFGGQANTFPAGSPNAFPYVQAAVAAFVAQLIGHATLFGTHVRTAYLKGHQAVNALDAGSVDVAAPDDQPQTTTVPNASPATSPATLAGAGAAIAARSRRSSSTASAASESSIVVGSPAA